MRKFTLLALALFGFAPLAFADAFQAPRLTGPIVDEVGVLNRDHYANLDAELRALSETGTAQVAVLIPRSLQGLAIEDYGIRVAEAWRIGAKSGTSRDRGAIFIFAPNERRMRIEVGYGLEGDLSDAIASRILEEVVKPEIKSRDLSNAVNSGVQALIRIVRGTAPDEALPARKSGPRGEIPTVFIWVFIALFLLLSRRGRRARRSLYGGFGGGGFGGGGFGGGGGFSGGGGSFGGGGSSSSW